MSRPPLASTNTPRRFNRTLQMTMRHGMMPQITLLRNVGTAIRAGLQATEHIYQFVCHAGGCSPCQRSLDIRTSEANHQFIPAGFSLLSPRLARIPLPSLRPLSRTTTRVCRPATGPSAWHLPIRLPFASTNGLSRRPISIWCCARGLLEAVSIRRCPCT